MAVLRFQPGSDSRVLIATPFARTLTSPVPALFSVTSHYSVFPHNAYSSVLLYLCTCFLSPWNTCLSFVTKLANSSYWSFFGYLLWAPFSSSLRWNQSLWNTYLYSIVIVCLSLPTRHWCLTLVCWVNDHINSNNSFCISYKFACFLFLFLRGYKRNLYLL